MALKLLADTNAILALLDRQDPNHQAARAVLPVPLILPSLVLPEIDYLATTRLGATVARTFQKAVVRGDFEIIHNTNADFSRALEIQETYADLELGLVDSSIMAIAERLGNRQVFTFDRRHFLPIKPQGLGYFQLFPEQH
jgi:uncharacterized protein